MSTLESRTALVTGAGSGLGREIALTLARQGANVGVADIHMATAQTVVAEIVEAGGKAIAIEMDVTSEADVETGTKRLVEHFGTYNTLVSNAGIQIVDPVDQYSFDNWQRMMAIHLNGAFLTTRSALRHMYNKEKGGSIIYIGSVHSHEASKLKAPYVAAKHGLIGLAKVVAKEAAAHNVRANVVCPGFVETPLVRKQIPEQARELGISEEDVVKNIMLAETVDGEFTSASDIADMVSYLASFPSLALTGQSITVSHGWGMR
ncbi:MULTISPECIES: 3-hydroxybutyrate dehydrogenase [Brucella/Ochrobactrum group]|uniref:3-hydroxybutyrate dehydrogenase n=1 Tax=Brucella/Ochrobactrum group TaxID=2826938 RepID=UPI0011217BFF|nr:MULTISPECIES: 3-hydroxybutyrate dehydrogenase [Brucella/Ochrobactrum group]